MRHPLRCVPLLALLAGLWPSAAPAAPFTATDMMKLRRLSDPQVSPDGLQVAFTLTEIDLAGGRRNTDLWLVNVSGGEPRRIVDQASSDTYPRWSPEGRRLAFLSTREGAPQVFLLDFAGEEPRRVTALAGGVESVAWSDGRRKPLLVAPLDGGPLTDLTPGGDDVPPFSLAGTEDFAVSPGGQEICFARKDAKDEAWSTEIVRLGTDGKPLARVTRINDAFLAGFGLGPGESVTYAGAEGRRVQWELGGPYWSHPEGYARFDPRDHARNFKTPTLVVHGEKDYRVPIEQGLAMFTALQRQRVPSRLVVFPDEGHWVLKPANSVRWYAEVIDWLDRWTRK